MQIPASSYSPSSTNCAVNVASQDLADTVVVVVVVVVVHAKNPLAVSGVPFDLHLA